MGVSCKIKRAYPQKAKQVIARLKSLIDTKCAVGWFDGENATKAYKNDRGTIGSGITSTNLHRTIPPRPFIMNGIEDKKNDAIKVLAKGIKVALNSNNSKGINDGFENFGKEMVQGIKDSIDKVQSPPLRPYTIGKRKMRGNDSIKPLIDTGEMKEATTYKVLKKGVRK